MLSDASELRLAFGGSVLVMFALGILIGQVLLRTLPGDLAHRQTIVEASMAGAS